MGSAAGSVCFLAYAVLAMNHRRFCRVQRKMQLKAVVDRLQLLRFTLPSDLPIAIPDALIVFPDPGDSRTGSIRAFRMKELTAIQIAQGQMSEINVARPRHLSLHRCDPWRAGKTSAQIQNGGHPGLSRSRCSTTTRFGNQ